jgi:hypothetical protein
MEDEHMVVTREELRDELWQAIDDRMDVDVSYVDLADACVDRLEKLGLIFASDAEALATFTDYFVRNYPGPNTIIGDPLWHAPKIFRAAQYAMSAKQEAA